MKLLLDTNVLLWLAWDAPRLSAALRDMIDDESNSVYFSPISIWETAIKATKDRADFPIDAVALHAGLVANGYVEIPVRTSDALMTAELPMIHHDPFERMLLAQALAHGVTLVTADRVFDEYPVKTMLV